MRCACFAIAVAVGLIFAAAPAFAQSAEDASAWLNDIGAKHNGKPFTADAVRTASSVSLQGVDFAKLKAADVAKLSAMPQLYSITAADPRIGDDIVIALTRLPNPRLTDFNLFRASITDAALAAMANHRTLASLGIEQTKVTAAGVKHLTTIKTLRTLRIGDTAIGDAGLEALQYMPALRSLTLQSMKGVTRKGWAALGQMQNMESLNLQFAEINEDVEAIAAAPKLQDMTLMSSKLDDIGGQHLGKFKNMRRLFVWNTKITDKSMPAIGSLAELETIYLNGTGITDEGLKSLANLKKLRTLWLDRTAITDAGMAHLTGLPALTWIRFEETKVTDAGLLKLAEIKTLTSVGVRKSAITDDGIKKFNEILPKARVSK